MTRLPDWRPRLAAYVQDAWRKPFRYGEHDCSLFAAGAVEAMTGVNPAAPLPCRYDTLQGGLEALEAFGFKGPADVAMSLFQRVPKAQAQVGDLVVADMPDGPAVGVVQGPRVYFVGEAGLMTIDLLDKRVRMALRV